MIAKADEQFQQGIQAIKVRVRAALESAPGRPGGPCSPSRPACAIYAAPRRGVDWQHSPATPHALVAAPPCLCCSRPAPRP